LLSKIELAAVADRLAYERQLGEKSKYASYIDVLPTLKDDRLLSLPRFWDSKRLDLVTDGGQLLRRMKNDERKDIGKMIIFRNTKEVVRISFPQFLHRSSHSSLEQ
jgi:hypothetical protein